LPTLHGRITPDGNYYFAWGGIEQSQSFRIEGSKITTHQSTERIASNGQTIRVSPDSRFVCLPTGGGNGSMGYSTNVYPVDDLKRPEPILQSGAYPRTVGFDPVGNRVFARNHDTALIVYSETGIEKSSHKLTPRGQEPRQFVSDSSGKRLLVAVADGVMVVEWPSK